MDELCHSVTFYVSRRVPAPPRELPVIASALGSGSAGAFDLGDAGFLVLDGPFRTARWLLHLTGVPPTLTAPATLRDRHGRRVCGVEVELSSWSHTASEVAVRPTARRPNSWTSRKLRRYFASAHAAADLLGRELTLLSWARVVQDHPPVSAAPVRR